MLYSLINMCICSHLKSFITFLLFKGDLLLEKNYLLFVFLFFKIFFVNTSTVKSVTENNGRKDIKKCQFKLVEKY